MKKIALTLIVASISLSNAYAEVSYKASGRLIKKERVVERKKTAPPPKAAVMASFADIVEDLLPTVVNISALQKDVSEDENQIDQELSSTLPESPIFNNFRKQLKGQNTNEDKKKIFSIGSGFLISKDGLVVTNNHVIDEVSEITVSTNNGVKYQAKIIATDEKTDLALLKIDSNKNFKFAKFGDSNKSRIGDWVIVIGNPYSLGSSVSIGIVSARSRSLNNVQNNELIQTDAAINKGNSGGPMFNIEGEVIGINSAIFSPSGSNVGIGFATPSSSAERIIKQLKEKGEVTRGWIGISIQEVNNEIAEAMKIKELTGAFINEITEDGPADQAGIMPADIILEFNGQKITSMKDLPKAVSNYPTGKSATILLWRNGEEKTLKVEVKKLQKEGVNTQENIKKEQIIGATDHILDLTLAEISIKIRKGWKRDNIEGLIVKEIDIKSQAAKKGIMLGDIITLANQKPVKTLADLEEEIAKVRGGNNKLLLSIKRDQSYISAILNLE
jgi:serine protease Do